MQLDKVMRDIDKIKVAKHESTIKRNLEDELRKVKDE